MKTIMKIIAVTAAIMLMTVSVLPVFAEDIATAPAPVAAVDTVEENTAEKSDDGVSVKAIAAAAIIAVVATAGAIAMAISVKHSVEGSARQPEAAGNIRTTMMMGLVFIETAIIYALIVAILIIFVL